MAMIMVTSTLETTMETPMETPIQVSHSIPSFFLEMTSYP